MTGPLFRPAGMTELLGLLADRLAFLLEPGRFRIVDSRSGEHGDATVTLASTSMLVEIVRDRGETSLRLRPDDPPGDWFWIGMVRRAMDGDLPGSDELDAGAITFLRANLDDLESRFGDPGLRERLLRELRLAQAGRAAELFGGPPA
jgi:hypothetical protein